MAIEPRLKIVSTCLSSINTRARPRAHLSGSAPTSNCQCAHHANVYKVLGICILHQSILSTSTSSMESILQPLHAGD